MRRRRFVALLLGAFPTVGVLAKYRPAVARHSWVEAARTYGSADGRKRELVMQDILDDWAHGVQLAVPETSGFLVLPYEQQPMRVEDALRTLADLIGWEVRWPKWGAPTLAEGPYRAMPWDGVLDIGDLPTG